MGQTQTDFNKLIYSILSGWHRIKFGSHSFYVSLPDENLLYQAELLYEDLIEEHKYSEDFLRSSSLDNLLDAMGVWTKQDTKDHKALSDSIVELQKRICRHFYGNPQELEAARKSLENVRLALSNMSERKYLFESNTIEGWARSQAGMYVFKSLLHDNNKEKVNLDDNGCLLYRLFNQWLLDTNNYKLLRQVSKSNEWQHYWSSDHNLFAGSPLTTERQVLIWYSRFYDSIRECGEKPSNQLIEDDDAIDGWVAIKQEEGEKHAKENTMPNFDAIAARHGNAGEVFLPARSKDEASAIYDRNSFHQRIIQRQRKKIIEQRGEVKETEFPDVQLRMRNQ